MEDKKTSKGYDVAVGGAKKVVRLLAYALILLFIIYLGKTAYELGYKVFDQKPLDTPEEAKVVSVTVTEDMSVYQIGELLQEKGLIEEPRVFWLQEKLSDFRGEIEPGTYTLITAQPVDEMLATMARAVEEDEEES